MRRAVLYFITAYLLFIELTSGKSVSADVGNNIYKESQDDKAEYVTRQHAAKTKVKADLSDTKKTASVLKGDSKVIINLDLNKTTTRPQRRSYGDPEYGKMHEKEFISSIFKPEYLRSIGDDPPAMKLDVSLQSALHFINSLLSSQGVDTYADTVARKAADIYTTYHKHSKKELVKPQVVEFRSGKPSLVYAFDADDILKSVDNFLASTLVRSYTDQLARKAGSVLRAAKSR